MGYTVSMSSLSEVGGLCNCIDGVEWSVEYFSTSMRISKLVPIRFIFMSSIPKNPSGGLIKNVFDLVKGNSF